MNVNRTAQILAALLALVARTSAAELEFQAYLSVRGEIFFVLGEPQRGAISEWLPVGGNFEGSRIVSFDEKKEVLTVAGRSGMQQLPLKSPQVAPALPTTLHVAGRAVLFFDLTADNQTRFGGVPIDLAEIRRKIANWAHAETKPMIVLRAKFHEEDDEGLQRAFQRIKDIGSECGVRGFGLQSKAPRDPKFDGSAK